MIVMRNNYDVSRPIEFNVIFDYFRIVSSENKTITTIEDLSNDLLFEIFDYFDGGGLYKAFWKLNTRFQNLLMYSSYPLKITSNAPRVGLSDYCTQFLFPNRHRIISLKVARWNPYGVFSKSLRIDSSFQRLESFSFRRKRITEFISILKSLTSLPHLVSLDLFSIDTAFAPNLTEIYQLILSLPALKSLCFAGVLYFPNMSLKKNISNQYSTIKCMTINNVCDFEQLIILLSYTPQLQRLILQRCPNSVGNFDLTVSNLRHLDLKQIPLKFNEFERFIKKICSQLRIMRIKTNSDVEYLDADRWERLISQHIPYLHTFDFCHHEWTRVPLNITEHHRLLHRFTSSFWIERQWILHLESDLDQMGNNTIIYSISSYK
jgi:hypothetical protein